MRVSGVGVALVLALVWPGAAVADIHYVDDATGSDDSDCTVQSDPCATIQYAVNHAAVVNDDTIQIAPGTYNAFSSLTKRLHFVGAGAGSLDTPGATRVGLVGNFSPAITLGAGGSIRALRAQGATALGFGTPGIVLMPEIAGSVNHIIADVVAQGGSPGGAGLAASPGIAGGVPSITVSGGAIAGDTSGGAAVYLTAVGTASFANTELRGGEGGVGLFSQFDGSVSLTGTTVSGGPAVSLVNGDLTADRSRFTGVAPASAAYGLRLEDSTNAEGSDVALKDSLVTAEGQDPVADTHAVSLAQSGTPGPISFSAQGSTLVARGVDPEAAVHASSGDGSISATLRNTIARVEGGTEPDEADLIAGDNAFSADFSSFSSSLATPPGSVPAPGSASNISGDPQLAADFTLAACSPLIDKGDPSIVTAGQLDLAGLARSLDGNGDGVAAPDIGAFERPDTCSQGEPPPQPNQEPALSGVSMTNKVFAPKPAGASVAQRRKRRVKRGTTFRYTLSEPAAVAITIERQLKGRRVRGKCRKPTRRNRGRRACKRFKRVGVLRADEGAGARSTEFSGRFRGNALRPGRYRARLVANDPQGLNSAERRLSFRIVKP